jgi:hypothetical protein
MLIPLDDETWKPGKVVDFEIDHEGMQWVIFLVGGKRIALPTNVKKRRTRNRGKKRPSPV